MSIGSLKTRRLNESDLSRDDYVVDINLAGVLNELSDLLDINITTFESRLLSFLDRLLVNQIDVYHNTVVTPPYDAYAPYKKQPISVDHKDPYHPSKEKQFDAFMAHIERLEQVYDSSPTPQVRAEIILRLLAPLNLAPIFKAIYGKLNSLMIIVTHKPTDIALARLIAVLKNYETLFKRFYFDLVHDKDKIPVREDEFPQMATVSQRGSIMYLAFISHSISRMFLDPLLEKGLLSAFDSASNPGYKEKDWANKHYDMNLRR